MKIIIPGDPISKMRPRFSSAGRSTRTYDAQEKLKQQKRKELNILAKFESKNDLDAFFKLPLKVTLEYHMPIPNSDSIAIRNAKLWGLLKPSHKPDIDNLIKWGFDIANGILWHDDAQIVKLQASQIYSENPCTILTIDTINENTMSKEHDSFFKTFSPDDLSDFLLDLCLFPHGCDRFVNIDKSSSREEMQQLADQIIKFSSKWCDKLKKVRSK